MRRRIAKPSQLALPFRSRGGARRGAGRKPNGPRPLVSHATRAPLAPRFPVHVTVKLERGLPSLRQSPERAALERAFRRGSDRFGFRLVHYSVQADHVHLIAEAGDRKCLTRGLQGLLIRIAKGLNRLWRRSGSVLADRYHDRILRTPREVRNALAYVLLNASKHRAVRAAIDAFSSGRWFEGWKGIEVKTPRGEIAPVARARTWLLGLGWRRHGLVHPGEVPG